MKRLKELKVAGQQRSGEKGQERKSVNRKERRGRKA